MNNRTTSDVMKDYGKQNYRLTVVQTIIYFFTLLAAVYLGSEQNKINKSILEIERAVSIAVIYADHRVNIYNKGKTNVWIHATRLSKQPMNLGDGKPKLIPPGEFYYIFGDTMESEIRQKVLNNKEYTLPFEIYLKDQYERKFIVNNVFLVQVRNNEFSIHSQTIAILERDW